tara:strand:+ start:197 stop:805 length:609 start_codon:yes stop_codon:yes gene_type:complete
MTYLLLGFFTGLSLILAIGAQNIFVIEQGLKKQFIFTVCLICSISDLILIFVGIFLFNYFDTYFKPSLELILNILLFLFLINFIWNKIQNFNKSINFSKNIKTHNLKSVIFKTLGFTYLNPHVYSDTVFFLGNFSKNFLVQNKYIFGVGAAISSFIFFFTIGYLSKYLSNFLKSEKVWKRINFSIIVFMCFISFYVLKNIFI